MHRFRGSHHYYRLHLGEDPRRPDKSPSREELLGGGPPLGPLQKAIPELVEEAHASIVRLYEAGRAKPLIYETVPFEELPEVLDLLKDRKTYGKLVANPLSRGG